MRSRTVVVWAVCCVSAFAALAPATAASPASPAGIHVTGAVHHDESPPLRLMKPRPPVPGPDRTVPNRVAIDPRLALLPEASEPDPVRQIGVGGAGAAPQPVLSFPGLSSDDNAAVVGYRIVPPDTQGDVGRRHYVQWINVILAVYDKATGERTFGPIPGNTVWSGFGGTCETDNDGDPVVLYDHLADRWLLSQFALSEGGHQCVAVSTTGDPAGSYYRYDFEVSPGPNGMNDYPKLGVWPGAYTLTVNEFQGGLAGAVAVAFERDAMLAGNAARLVKFGPLQCDTECFFSLQPGHLEGPAPPPGTPIPFVMAFDDETWGTSTGTDGYRLWELAVDWSAPAAATFTPLGQVDAPEFDANLCRFSACVRQPPGGEPLDALSQFTMYRAQYRVFSTHATLLVNHTVDADGEDLPGVRWAELRNDGAGWFLYQTGTFAPDDTGRWMGSIAMDGAGDILLAYSVSSRSTYPGIRTVGRTAGDPLGQLPRGEVELAAGAGVQRSSFHRWGDYSTVSIDPVDDCTFWITNELYENTGSFDFKTWIGAISFPRCAKGKED